MTTHQAITLDHNGYRANYHTVDIDGNDIYTAGAIVWTTPTGEHTMPEGWPIYRVNSAFGPCAWTIAINPEEVK